MEQALATVCEPRSRATESESKAALIREWIVKFALNAGQPLDAEAQAIYEALWIEGFADLPVRVLEAAFRKTLRACKFWPLKIADIREHVSHAEENAGNAAAEKAWQTVLDLRRLYWNPDMPGGFVRGMPRLDERTQQAVRAAGVFRDHDSVEALHVLAKKRFVESFIAWGELEKDEFLLPEGEVKNLLADVAQAKALPAPETYETMRARGLAYAQRLKASPAEAPDFKSAPREVRSRTFPVSTRSLEEQKRILREKGFLPQPQPAEV